MSKRNEKISQSSPERRDGLKTDITISAVKTEEGFQIVEMFGYSIRADINNGEPWFVVQDFSDALGIDRTTIPKMIKRNPAVFEDRVSSVDVTSSEQKDAKLRNLKDSGNSLLTINELATYTVLGRLSSGRMKSKVAQESVLKFQRAFPELLKMIRTGEVKIIKNEEWDVKRYLSKGGYKRVSKSIHDFITTLARDPAHEDKVHINNAILVNKIVFGHHIKNIRDTATAKQLEAVYALDNLNSALIEQGQNVQRDRQRILTEYYNRHFSKMGGIPPVQSLISGCSA